MKKLKKTTCDCRRRKRGNPKVGTGPCYGYGCMRAAVRDRIEGKREVRRWKCDPERDA